MEGRVRAVQVAVPTPPRQDLPPMKMEIAKRDEGRVDVTVIEHHPPRHPRHHTHPPPPPPPPPPHTIIR